VICSICDAEPEFSWTDTHGVAQCRCGAPYRLFHYDTEKKREDKPPELLIAPEWMERCREFWNTYKRPMPGGHSFPGGQERASYEDMVKWEEFCDSKPHPIAEPGGGA
jgi:hypothetical protein